MVRFRMSVLLILFMVALAVTGRTILLFVSLSQQKNALQQQQSALSALHKEKPKRKNSKKELLQSVINAAELSGLRILSVTAENSEENAAKLSFEIQGDFLVMMTWLTQLANQHVPLLVDSLAIKSVHGDERIKIMARLFKQSFDTVKTVSGEIRIESNPFASVVNANISTEQPNCVDVPLEQLKFVGFLQMGMQKKGIVTLPNGQSSDVSLDDVCGRDHARVIDLDEDKIVFELNGKTIIKKMVSV